jgi:hypothetical protein
MKALASDSISKTILKFYHEIENSPHHRYKSWDHCYTYFRMKNPDPGIACLHLAFYLASWGMYRGSTFVLKRDYLIHMPIVGRLIAERDALQGKNVSEIAERTGRIFDLFEWIKKQYEELPTDTLTTKILLGTLACVPAYDVNLVKGLRLRKLTYSHLNPINFGYLLGFVKNPPNLAQFEKAQIQIEKANGMKYPIMKLVDMYFWQLGEDVSAAKRR